MSNLIPQHMSHEQLADILLDMSERVRAHDSWEGNIEYMIPDEFETADVAVRGGYRIGNSQGQGGFRLIGIVPTAGVQESKPPM